MCRHSHPVRRLCLSRRSSLHYEASSVEYVIFDWLNVTYYVVTPQRDHGTVAVVSLLLPELRPQACYPIPRGLASVTPNGDPGAFVGLG